MRFPESVTLDELPKVIESIVLAAFDEGAKAMKIEGAVECADRLAQTQRYRTGRAAHSTTVTGRHPTPFDPGPSPNDQLAFYLPASRTELMQAAEHTIPHDPAGANAHVIEAAGKYPENRPYPGHLERRFRAGQSAITATEANNSAVAARASKRAERELKGAA